MANRKRNQPCECRSGRKAKFCCGLTTGPSVTELARAFLAGVRQEAALTLLPFSRETIAKLHAEVLELPQLDTSLQVAVPGLITPDVDALLEAVERDDVEAVEAALPPVLARVDTPLERDRLARAVCSLRDVGRIARPVGACALLELGSPQLDALMTAALVQSAAVALGRTPTPGGLLIAG